MPASSERILGFDGLRAIAFLLVFLSHKVPAPETERYGTTGVWLFFVLSGFLITRILMHSRYAIEQRQESLRFHLLDFWTRRSLRILPVYYAFLAVMTLLSLFGLAEVGPRLRQLSDVFFFSNFYIDRHGWSDGIGHLWSLAVEQQFYIFFAPLALLSPLRRLPWVCAGVLGVGIIAHLVLYVQGRWHISFDVNSFANFGLMAIGGLAAIAADRPLPRMLTHDLTTLATLAAFLLLPLLISPMELWLQVGRLSGALAGLLLLQIYQRQENWAVTALNAAPLRRLGVVSYGAYLFHVPINVAGILAVFGYVSEIPLFARVALDLVVTIALAELSWLLLETPFRALAKKRRPAIITRAAA